jgi:DNA helicase-2/ATP-dependent DNA helicase PcrA
LADFLRSFVLQKETDEYDQQADRVALMTLHAAKGLEFPVVFIAGCEDDLIPFRRGDRSLDPEEERRLFYVGMTRAKEKLILTHARSRILFGETLRNNPSCFLDDIEAALKELHKMAAKKSSGKKNGDLQLSLFSSNLSRNKKN